jgi:hypothetical protein
MMVVGWHKSVHIRCSPVLNVKFSETEFSRKIHPICGPVRDVRVESNDAGMTVCVVFPSNQAASCLDQANLTEIIVELLGDESVEIHIEAGGVGKP